MFSAALQSVHIKDRLPERLAARAAAPRRLYRPDVDIRRRGNVATNIAINIAILRQLSARI